VGGGGGVWGGDLVGGTGRQRNGADHVIHGRGNNLQGTNSSAAAHRQV